MTTYNIIINDKCQPECQRAVLSNFCNNLESQGQLNVIRSSDISNQMKWSDVSEVPTNHLNMVLKALEPASDTYSIFIPGHVIPNSIKLEDIHVTDISTNKFFSLSRVDICLINNACKSISDFFESIDINDYNQINDYTLFNINPLGSNSITKHLVSASLISKRPWYYRSSPYRDLWHDKVLEAYNEGYLSINTIEQDIKNDYLRPSFLKDFFKISKQDNSYLDSTFLDKSFIPPESRLHINQLSIMDKIDQEKSSALTLENRVINFKHYYRVLIGMISRANKILTRKIKRIPSIIKKIIIFGIKAIIRILRRYFINMCYFVYKYSFRFLIKNLTKNKGGAKSKD